MYILARVDVVKPGTAGKSLVALRLAFRNNTLLWNRFGRGGVLEVRVLRETAKVRSMIEGPAALRQQHVM